MMSKAHLFLNLMLLHVKHYRDRTGTYRDTRKCIAIYIAKYLILLYPFLIEREGFNDLC